MQRILMVVFSYYPADPRVRREAEALQQSGREVEVICLRGAGETEEEVVRGVTVHRLPLARRRGSKLRYLWEYGAFTIAALLEAWRRHRKQPVDLVHIHNMPDFLVLSGLGPRLSGARIVLDLHDPMPEVYMSKYGLGASHPVIRFLRLVERGSIGLADQVLTPNIAFRDVFVGRGCPADKVEVVMNSPQESVFHGDAGASPSRGNGFRVMFHGTVVERHGLDTAVEAVAALRDSLPDLRLDVYGDGDFVTPFLRLVEDRGLEERVAYHGHVSLEAIAAAIPGADVGLIPNKRGPFTDINMPTRIFEYLCKHKPVIAPRTPGIADYFAEDSLFFFEPGDADSLARVIQDVHADDERRAAVVARGVAIYEQHRWELEQRKLLDVFERLERPTEVAP